MDIDHLRLPLVAVDTDLLPHLPVLTLADTDRLPLLHTIQAEDTETDITVTDLLPLLVAEAVPPLSVQRFS